MVKVSYGGHITCFFLFSLEGWLSFWSHTHRQNKLWFWVSSPKEWFHGLAKISSGLGVPSPSLLENWLPTPARSGSHCRGKWRQAASVSENLASLYKVQIPFQSVNSSKLIQPAQERNRIGLVCCAPHVCGRVEQLASSGCNQCGRAGDARRVSHSALSRGGADQTRLLSDYVGFKESWTRQRQAEKCFKEGK